MTNLLIVGYTCIVQSARNQYTHPNKLDAVIVKSYLIGKMMIKSVCEKLPIGLIRPWGF